MLLLNLCLCVPNGFLPTFLATAVMYALLTSTIRFAYHMHSVLQAYTTLVISATWPNIHRLRSPSACFFFHHILFRVLQVCIISAVTLYSVCSYRSSRKKIPYPIKSTYEITLPNILILMVLLLGKRQLNSNPSLYYDCRFCFSPTPAITTLVTWFLSRISSRGILKFHFIIGFCVMWFRVSFNALLLTFSVYNFSVLSNLGSPRVDLSTETA
jgi:hypothetical protein